MAELTDAQIDAARERGRIAAASEPRAISVAYDRTTNRIVFELSTGISMAVPTRLIEGLGAASPDQLANVCVLGQGYGIRWAALDVDMSVPGLMAGVLGTRSHMAKLAGQAKSQAKAAAARANGAKGGRPRKPISV